MKHRTKCLIGQCAGATNIAFGITMIARNFNYIAPISIIVGTLVILFGIMVSIIFAKEEKKGE